MVPASLVLAAAPPAFTDSPLTVAVAVLVTAFVVVYPLYCAWDIRRNRGLTGRRAAAWRLAAYREILVVQWLVSGAVLAWWLAGGGPLAELGLGWQGWRSSLAMLLAAVAAGLLVLHTRALLRDPEQLRQAREQFGDAEMLMPRDRRERRWFDLVSLTAGFCEELLYRGLLIFWLTPLLGLWGAAFLSTLVFGFGHLYQGSLAGFVRTFMVGAVMVGLVLLGGSIWPAVVLHAVIDLAAGRMGVASSGRELSQERTVLPTA